MIKAGLQTKGEQTRARCVAGVKGLFARIDRRIQSLRTNLETCQIVVEIASAQGVLSAQESETMQATPLTSGRDPADVIGEIIGDLDQLTLPDGHKIVKIEIVSVKGVVNAVKTEIRRHRWD